MPALWTIARNDVLVDQEEIDRSARGSLRAAWAKCALCADEEVSKGCEVVEAEDEAEVEEWAFEIDEVDFVGASDVEDEAEDVANTDEMASAEAEVAVGETAASASPQWRKRNEGLSRNWPR